MKILLTGSNGMVGRNILDRLQTTTYPVLAPTRKELDLFNSSAVLQFLKKHQPDFIIHCAGKVGGIQANIKDPVGFFIENLEMGKNLVLAAREAGVRNLLNLGSSCMYPRQAPNPLKETAILTGELEPTNEGYALAKISIQKLCTYISAEDARFHYKTLIPCNLYGYYDKFDPHSAHLIPAVIHKIHQAKINGEPIVTIWGDGTARREFLYAGNVADFIVTQLENFAAWPCLMNLGASLDYSVNDYYEMIKRIVGFQGSFEYDLTKPIGMMRKWVDISLQTSLGWHPPVGVEEGIELTYQYYLKEFVVSCA